MVICPNKKDPVVLGEFNEIVLATNETVAYRVWSLNGGNAIDKAPNGAESKLFLTLLDYFNGDRTKAIKAKCAVFSKKFFNWFGNWTGVTEDGFNDIEILNDDGSINFELLEQLSDEFFNNADEKLFKKGRKTLRSRKEHHPHEDNTLQHLQNVVKSAQESNVSDELKQHVVIAAALHDLAKPFHGGLKHGFQSEEILDKVFKGNVSNLARFAIANHMMTEEDGATFTEKDAERIVKDAIRRLIDVNNAIDVLIALHIADITSGRSLEDIDSYSNITIQEAINTEVIEKKRLLEEAAQKILQNAVSKVVDENGEPLVVWHGSRERFDEFKKERAKSPSGKSLFTKPDTNLDKAFYFTDNKKYGEMRGTAIPVYLNLKRPFTEEILKRVNKPSGIINIMLDNYYDDGKFQMHTETVAEAFSIAREVGEDVDGVIGIDMGETDHEFDFAVKESNQIKHVENLGTWNPDNPNIYLQSINKSLLLARLLGFDQQSKSVNNSIFFGNSFEELQNGNQVSSLSIMNHLLSSNSVPQINLILAQVLSRHDVPVLFGTNEFGKPAETIERDGGFVVIIDPELFLLLRTAEATLVFMHEIIHALTVSAFNLPLTIEDKELAVATNKLFSLFTKEMPESEWSRFDSITGAYILSDKFEFVAEFATNQNSRLVLYEKAVEIDKKYNGRVRLRLKKFINSVTNFLVNKRVFKLKQDEFNDYQNRLKSYLFYKQPIKRGNITDTELLDAIYSTYDFEAADKQRDMNRRVNMIRYFEGITKHAVEVLPEQTSLELNTEEKEETKSPDKLRGDIASYLQVRLLSITTSSVFTEEQKSKYTALTKLHINMMSNKNIKAVTAFTLIAQDMIPQMLHDLEEARNLKQTSDSYYMLMYHDNFSTYHKIFSDLQDTLNNPDYYQTLQNEIKDSNIFDKLGAVKDLGSLKTLITKASSVAYDGRGHMKYILINNLKQRAKDITLETGSDEYLKWIDEFETVTHDSSGALARWGAKDGSSDPTIRAILYLINKADRLKRDDSYRKLSGLLKLQKALKSGESMSDIYETVGLYKTGNVKRRINYGKYKQEEAEMYALINRLYGLPETNRRIPDDKTLVKYKSLYVEDSKYNYKEGDPQRGKEIPIRRAWNLLKNEWLSIHAHRKYKADYYSAYAGLSEETLGAINGIRDMINQIKAKCERDKDGHYLYDSLSDEDWNALQGLYIQRRSLSSPLKLDGTLKAENTPEYDIYKELSELNETLYNKDKDYHDKEAWWNAREEKKKQLIELNTDLDGEVNVDAVARGLKKWDDRNSKRIFKKDGEDVCVYKQIDDEIYEITKEDKPIFELNGDGGALYEANEQRIRTTINLFRNLKGEVSLDFLTESAKKIVKLLELENKDIRKQAIEKDTTKKLKKQWAAYKKALKKVRKKYLVTRKTDEYLAKHADDILILSLDMIQTAESLPRWCRKAVVHEEFLDEYTELVPGDGWITLKDRNDLLNPEFEKLLLMDGNEDETTIPKPELYDNSEEFRKIENSPTLLALYKEVVSIIKQSNDLFYNNARASKYRLPLISGSMLNYILSQNSGFWKYVKELAGYNDKGQGVRQDDQFGMNVDSVLDSFLDFSETVNNNSTIQVNSLRGSRADNRQFNVIPPRYTTPLDDPSIISPDLIGILYEYYDSAMNVKYKGEIKDTVEAFIDMLEYRTYVQQEKDESGKITTKLTKGKDTVTYRSARKAADMFLYDIKQEPVKAGNWNISKSALLLKQVTTAINLGLSPVVALTGFFTSSYTHMINAIVGDKAYGKYEAGQAAGIVLWNGIKTGFGVMTAADNDSDNKLMGIMEMFNLVDLGEKKFKKSHQNRFFRFLSNNYTFGLLTWTDYVIKSNIAVSLLLSHRFVNGRFIAKEDIRNNARNDSPELYANKIKEWNEGVSVWDVLYMEDGVIQIKPEYRKAFEDSYDVLYNRIIKTAEQADGVATETQKAEITSNLVGAAVLVHRQYLPLQMQDRWSKTVWDMDQQLMKLASFRSAREFLNILTFKSIYDAYKTEGNFIKNYKESVKKNYNRYFNNNDTDYDYKLSRARRKHLKKIITELIVYGATFKLLLSLLFSAADDKDNKDKLLLQLAAYVARRTLWEVFNAYRPEDVISSIQTVTAETSVTDKIQYFLNEFNSRLTLLGTILHLVDATDEEDLIKRGVYKGWTKSDKALFKFLPLHNAYEQIFGSKDKRRYYENKIMLIND